MDNQLQKMDAGQLELRKNVQLSTRNLLNSIQKGDSLAVADICRLYMEKGIVAFDRVLSIPLFSRIPNLTHVYGTEKIHALITLLLTAFSESMNLVRPMNSKQIVICAYELVRTTEEDQLAMEDLILFFKGALEGKYGKIMDRLDQQTVFHLLESYRQERHIEFQRIKLEKHLQNKESGAVERSNQPDPISEHMAAIGGKLERLKEQLKEQREINRMKTFEKDL